MRKITFLTVLILASYSLFSQSTLTIEYFNWSNPVTFDLSPSPIISGYGTYSDSLSEAFDGKTFYEYNDEYYCIESWADYYYWFTKKHSHQFTDPQQYEFYYLLKDDLGMTSYIASHKYLGNYYPSLINLNFGNVSVKCNRLKNNYSLAQSNNEERIFIRQLKSQSIAVQAPVHKSQNKTTSAKYSNTIGRKNSSNNTMKKNSSPVKTTNTSSKPSSSSRSAHSRAVK